jgi:hypothetical protein
MYSVALFVHLLGSSDHPYNLGINTEGVRKRACVRWGAAAQCAPSARRLEMELSAQVHSSQVVVPNLRLPVKRSVTVMQCSAG